MHNFQSSSQLRCGDRLLDLREPQVMAIINVTPDSFSDGGKYHAGSALLDKILAQVDLACAEGASLIDVGGESTRPGATPVSEAEECRRVLPVVEAIAQRFDVVISVDSSNATVMRESAALGAGLINDVRALQRPNAMQAAATSGLPVCLMHMQGEPVSMQNNPAYRDIAAEVDAFLSQRIDACVSAGIASERIVLDPGFGFAKTLAHNLELFRRLPDMVAWGYPILVGVSRKSMIGDLTGRPVGERLAGSVAMAAMAVERGAHIIRVHDVKETVDAVRVAQALKFEKIKND
ncbi:MULTISPECIES: dihydropteroate synthase [Zhongshania]|jgi:dihydropteroate synthase|uniref:Dihydropteroate synthase n=1 Tax=Zhongshania antarctica TaxID=641702 RepID=A0A840R6R9_9GAMM|nr:MULTISPECIES: dihydropteroate synthase [Zhongshania]MBB5188945.1 dihydropteroate synthase [Zhongshania antarctica]